MTDLPLARTIVLTDAGTMAWSEALAAYDGTPSVTEPAVTIVYGLSVDGPTAPPTPVQDFALEAAGAPPSEGGSAPLVQDFAVEAASAQPAEGSAPIQNFAIEASTSTAREGN